MEAESRYGQRVQQGRFQIFLPFFVVAFRLKRYFDFWEKV